MGEFVTTVILIFAIACIALLIYSKVKEIRGKGCSGCNQCDKTKSCQWCSYSPDKK